MEKKEKHTVLIIEDDPDVLATLTKNVAYFGYEVITATDGLEGMRKLEDGGYDLVITDIVMPYVSGVGVVARLKEKNPEIPVIVITGYGKEPEEAAMEKNADLVLTKPVKINILRDHISKLIS